MHDYIVGGLARSHQDDLIREVLHEELCTEARQARDPSPAAGHSPRAFAHRRGELHLPHLQMPHRHMPHLRVHMPHPRVGHHR
jgi:hypothetical protein